MWGLTRSWTNRVVQDAGGAGMLMINSDNSLLPLMSDPKEAAGLMIWAATYVY